MDFDMISIEFPYQNAWKKMKFPSLSSQMEFNKKLTCQIDQKFHGLSISGIFRAIWALWNALEQNSFFSSIWNQQGPDLMTPCDVAAKSFVQENLCSEINIYADWAFIKKHHRNPEAPVQWENEHEITKI